MIDDDADRQKLEEFADLPRVLERSQDIVELGRAMVEMSRRDLRKHSWRPDRDRKKAVLKERLERCQKLAVESPDGVTANHIREIEAALLDDLRALEKQ
jgi:hypothetical protein